MVQWQDLRLPRAGPGFNSRCAQNMFFVFLCGKKEVVLLISIFIFTKIVWLQTQKRMSDIY